jgi:hypothetical protein
MIDYEILKDAIESLRTPSKLDNHPLANAPFVQQFLKRHPGYEGLTPGRRLGLILADLWRETFYPGDTTVKLKRQWDRFLVLEAGYFYPFRMKQPLPDGLPQIGWVLGTHERMAEIIANGHVAKARELLDARHNEFWEAICREPVKPDKQSDPEVIAPTTVASRQKAAIQKFAEFLNTIQLEDVAAEIPSPAPTESLAAPALGDAVRELPLAQPAPPIEVEATPPAIKASARLDAYLDHILPPMPIYVPDEWLPIIEVAQASRRVIIQGEIGSGKTELMRALAVNFRQAGLLPLYLSITQYALHATNMDVLHFFATQGLFGQAYLSGVERENFALAAGEAIRSDRLVILADQCDDLLETEWPIVSQRLNGMPRLVLAERNPRLTIDRMGATSIPMPQLSDESLLELLKATGASSALSEKVMIALPHGSLDVTPALALLAAQSARTDGEVHPVVVMGMWLDRVLKETRASGQVVAEVTYARRLLQYLAAVSLDIAPHPETTTELVRENVRRAFWTLPLRSEEEKQGWILVDFCVRAGLLTSAGERWQIVNPQVALALAAEFAAEQRGWVSLQPQHRQLMTWTAALIARRDADQQSAFLNALRQLLEKFTMLSFLEAADVAVEFNRLTSRPAQEFKSDVTRWLKELARVDSDAVRNASLLRAQRMGTNLVFSYVPPESIIPAADLDRYAYDLPELLYRLDISQPKGDVQTWLEDRGVQKGLIDSLAETPTPELKLRCAAWLQRSSLSKIMEFEADLVAIWNSRRRSALEIVAQLARDPNQNAVSRRLAKSILAKDDFILRLWNTSDEYIPLVFELLLALDKRMYQQPVSLNATEWRILD